MAGPTLIIQIPCFNEAASLGITLASLPRAVPGFARVEWMVIDDGSTDATIAVAKAAGVDRFNHNLETSERHYGQIVSTHTWRDRVATVQIAKAAGMDTCCGGIVGLGESEDDLLDLAFTLRELDVDRLTPLEALNLLATLKREAGE